MASLFQEQEYRKASYLSVFRPLVSILKLWPTYLYSFESEKSNDISKWIYDGYSKDQKAAFICFHWTSLKAVLIRMGGKSHLFSHCAISNLRGKSFSLSRSEINYYSYFNFYVELWCRICVEVKNIILAYWLLSRSSAFHYNINHSLIKFSKERYILLVLSIHKVFCSDNHFPFNIFCQNIFFSFYPLIKSSFAKNNQFLFLFLFPTRRLLIVLPLFPSSNLGSGLCLRKECFSDYSFASIPVKFLSGSAVEGKGVESWNR